MVAVAVGWIAPRRDGERFERCAAALRFDREAAHRLDVVAEELDAHRRLGGRREEIDDTAAHGVLADGADEVGVA